MQSSKRSEKSGNSARRKTISKESPTMNATMRVARQAVQLPMARAERIHNQLLATRRVVLCRHLVIAKRLEERQYSPSLTLKPKGACHNTPDNTTSKGQAHLTLDSQPRCTTRTKDPQQLQRHSLSPMVPRFLLVAC